MSRVDNRDYIFLVWKDFHTRQRYVIGKLSRNGEYVFEYDKVGVENAQNRGFNSLIAFPNIKKIYKSKDVFPAFSSRLPDRRRKDIQEILHLYGLHEYDAFELLKKSGGKLPTDSLEFIDPIFLGENKVIERVFYIAGVKYYDYCNGKEKIIDSNLAYHENLILRRDINNIYNKYAVKILTNNNKLLGYIPIYYSKAVSEAIKENWRINCIVINSECSNQCDECIKVKLTINK